MAVEMPGQVQPVAAPSGVRVEELARTLADEFRATTAELDRTGAFPHANYRRMREAGYLRAVVPTELGGLGAGMAELARGQQALARGCAATALAVNMHLFQLGFAAETWRKTAAPPLEALLRRVAKEGIVLGSTGADAVVAGELLVSTTAQRVEGGYRVSGRKFFCSQAPAMAVVRVNARDLETGEILVCSVPANAEGLRVVETWDTMGMRATASHDVVLEDVFVPDAAVGVRLPQAGPMRHPAMAGVATWFVVLIASVYLGVAEEARAEAYRALGGGINSSQRATELTDVLIGQMEAEYLTAVSVRDQVVARLERERGDVQAAVAQGILCKEIVTARAVAVVDLATQLAGGRSYFRKSPLERLARDARASRYHPPSAPVSVQMAGERAREAAAAAASQ
jgi:alkylation response protein AidB-like acyl-CoA dehydrogenase